MNKIILFVFFISLIISCKNKVNKKLINEINSSTLAIKQKKSYSKFNFFEFDDCCLEKKVDKDRNLYELNYNNKHYDLKIVFYPKKAGYFRNGNLEKDTKDLTNTDALLETFNIYTLCFPGENLEPVYEGYEEPSYYNYSFPASIKIYKLIKNKKWILTFEENVDEDRFYQLKKSDLRNL